MHSPCVKAGIWTLAEEEERVQRSSPPCPPAPPPPWPLGAVQGEGTAAGSGDGDSACRFQWLSPPPQVEYLHLVFQVETEILRKRHSREGEEWRKHNMENLFLPSPTVSFPSWHSRQGQTGSRYASGERLEDHACWGR